MDLNKKNMKNIMLLIVFAVLFYVGVQRIESVAAGVSFVVSIVFPFLLGAAMAFILNVPMSFMEKRLFSKTKGKAKKLKRPICLVLAILFVVAILWIVLLVVIPEVASTVASLSVNIEAALIKLQRWAMDIFEDNKQIEVWIASLQFDWDGIIHTAFGFLKNGAGNVLNSTMTVAKTVINSVMNFCVAFVFACYILLQKEKLAVQIRKILYAFFSKKVVTKVLDIASLSYKTFANFVTGQCCEAVILGTMFFYFHEYFKISLCTFSRRFNCIYCINSDFRCIYRMLFRDFSDLVADPMKAIAFVILFLVLQQVEGNLFYPHVVGGSVGLPSIWVLVAVTVGGSLMGIVGMLVFIPICSVLYALFREMVYKRLKERGIHDI